MAVTLESCGVAMESAVAAMVAHLEIAVSDRSLAALPWDTSLPWLVEFGLTSLELTLTDASNSRCSESDDARLARLLDRWGIRVSVCRISTGGSAWKIAEPLMWERLERAKRWNPKILVGDGGGIEDDPDRVARALRGLGGRAAEFGAEYCLELQSGLCSNHHGLAEMVRLTEHPHVAASFDTANFHMINGPVEGEVALAKICHLVKHVRLRDSSGQLGDSGGLPVGYGGAVNALRVYELMSVAGFRGPLVVDFQPGVLLPGTEDSAVKTTRVAMEKSVRTLRDCGFFDPLP